MQRNKNNQSSNGLGSYLFMGYALSSRSLFVTVMAIIFSVILQHFPVADQDTHSNPKSLIQIRSRGIYHALNEWWRRSVLWSDLSPVCRQLPVCDVGSFIQSCFLARSVDQPDEVWV